MTRGLLRHTTARLYADLQVIHVRALVNNSHVKNNKCTNVTIMFFLHAICHNCDVFRSMFVICRESPNINKAYIKHRWINMFYFPASALIITLCNNT